MSETDGGGQLDETARGVGAITPGLMVLHGNRAESLRDILIAWMRHHPLAPLENEVVLVQSNGIAQWLRLALAEPARADGGGGCGIAAALDLSLPSRFLWQAYRAVLGPDAVPEQSPFDKPRLTWRLMRVLPALLTHEVCAPLRRFFDDDADLRKRHQLAGRLADLFDQYQVYRADWLEAWAAGEDVLIDARGERRPVPPDQAWQPALWRSLLADVGAAGAGTSRAAVHARFLRVAADPDAVRPRRLPRRVMVFGISALPRQAIDVLAAIARWSQVMLCVHNPCQHYWADIVAERDWLRRERARQTRKPGMPEVVDEAALHLHAQPLLAAWGRQGRDFIAMLDDYDSAAERTRHAPRLAELALRHDSFDEPDGASLLAQLQNDIFDLRPLAETRTHWPAVDPARDDSLRFHVAHSAQREVEILHDALLAAFDADPDLRPRDVIVMVPDIDAYAPHIQAVFGLYARDDARHIPFSIADRGPRHHDPVLVAVERLLELPQARLSLPEVLDLLDVPAVRRRFGLAEPDLPLLARWAADAGVRWGLDGGQREAFGFGALGEQNSWAFGLRRLLYGYAAGAAEPWHGIEPHAEVGGLEAAVLGPLADFIDTLDTHARTLAQPAPPEVWGERLRGLLADFLEVEEADELRTLQGLEQTLGDWLADCVTAGFDAELPLAVVREHWLEAMSGGGLSQRFFAGAVTFATLMPMRAIPFQQVCLLGMNDGDYPRSRPPMDFDLMAGAYRPGDRSRREDDRYLFLEAVLSARARLHLSWIGRSVHDNAERPPSVLVAQLRDHLAAGWKLAGREDESESGRALLAALTVEHPLQPFSPRYFPAAGRGGLFTYAAEWRLDTGAGARVSTDAPLPPPERDEPLDLASLARVIGRPVERFFRERLGVHFETDAAELDPHEPFVLDGLENWRLQDELIAAQCAALDHGEPREAALDAALARIARRGELAPGAFATLMREALAEPMADLFERRAEALAEWSQPVPPALFRFTAELEAGRELQVEDRIGLLRANASGEQARVVLDSGRVIDKPGTRGGPPHYRHDKLLRPWVTHLAANLVAGPVTTLVIGTDGTARLAPLDAARARPLFGMLCAVWDEALRRPLPLVPRTGFAWLAGSAKGAADDEARKQYEGDSRRPGEGRTNVWLTRVWADYAALRATPGFEALIDSVLRPLAEHVGAGAGEGDA